MLVSTNVSYFRKLSKELFSQGDFEEAILVGGCGDSDHSCFLIGRGAVGRVTAPRYVCRCRGSRGRGWCRSRNR